MAVNTHRRMTHDSDFLKFNFNFFDSMTALGIIPWLCQDGQNSDGNGASLDENPHILTLLW